MKSFFATMEPWRKAEGSLHLYALPDQEERARLVVAQEALNGIEGLPLMPASYLHCTVQRLAQFDEDVTQAHYTQLGEALAVMCAALKPFDLDFGAPLATELSVGCWTARSGAWDRLLQGCRETVASTWGGDTPAPPTAPHLSLAYAKSPVDDAVVAARLANVPPIGTLHVGTLHLVSVTVRPERGTFDFTELANWDLGS